MGREAREALLQLENQHGPRKAGRYAGGPQPAQTQEAYGDELAAARVAAEAEALAEGEHRSQSARLEDSSASPADSLEYHDPVPAPSADEPTATDIPSDAPAAEGSQVVRDGASGVGSGDGDGSDVADGAVDEAVGPADDIAGEPGDSPKEEPVAPA